MLDLIGVAIIEGLGLGSIYAMIATGYTLILGASGVFNFAQGSIVMAGALVAFGLGTVQHLPVLIVVAIVAATGGIAGLVTHTVAVLPVTFRAGITNLTYGTFLSTLGVGLTFTSIIALAFGVNTYPVNDYVSNNPIVIGGLHIPPIYVVMMGSTLVLVAVFETVSRKTTAGLVMRATFSEAEGAELLGVSITKVVRRVFIAGCALAALAGFLVLPITQASAGIADTYAFYGFAAMAIGGYGSFLGAILGGLIVGLVGVIPQIWVNAEWADVLVYLAMVLVLLIRPQGLFGSGGTSFGAASLRDV
jgi:branched-subunit amino acid ABC-type transport system permease component